MAAGQRDLEAAPRLDLAADLGQVRAPARPSGPTPAAAGAGPSIGGRVAPTSSIRGGATAARRRRRGLDDLDRLARASRHADDLDARRRAAPRRRRPIGDDDPPRRPRRARAATIGRMPGHRPDLAAERQLADQRDRVRAGPDLLRAEQDPDRDREVERRAGLAQVRRREVDRDPPRRVDEAGVADRAADPLAGLLERGVGQADDREAGQPGATSTSTRMTRPSRPWSVADGTMASTPPTATRGALTRGSPAAHRDVSRRRAALSGRRRLRGRRGRTRLVDDPREVRAATARAAESAFVNMNGAPRVQRADRAAVLVHDLVVDRPLAARPRRS